MDTIRCECDFEMVDEPFELGIDPEAASAVTHVMTLKEMFAGERTLRPTREAMQWFLRQALRPTIERFRARVAIHNGFTQQDVMVTCKSLDVLMGLWQDLGGNDEELEG